MTLPGVIIRKAGRACQLPPRSIFELPEARWTGALDRQVRLSNNLPGLPRKGQGRAPACVIFGLVRRAGI